jgi:hypothetical protein
MNNDNITISRFRYEALVTLCIGASALSLFLLGVFIGMCK